MLNEGKREMVWDWKKWGEGRRGWDERGNGMRDGGGRGGGGLVFGEGAGWMCLIVHVYSVCYG